MSCPDTWAIVPPPRRSETSTAAYQSPTAPTPPARTGVDRARNLTGVTLAPPVVMLVTYRESGGVAPRIA